jgi:hypothetical protein
MLNKLRKAQERFKRDYYEVEAGGRQVRLSSKITGELKAKRKSLSVSVS